MLLKSENMHSEYEGFELDQIPKQPDNFLVIFEAFCWIVTLFNSFNITVLSDFEFLMLECLIQIWMRCKKVAYHKDNL